MKRYSQSYASGYTLPVFACAAAVPALHWLHGRQPIQSVPVDLVNQLETIGNSQTNSWTKGSDSWQSLAVIRR